MDQLLLIVLDWLKIVQPYPTQKSRVSSVNWEVSFDHFDISLY